jgi:hypothetical protein
MKAALAPKIFAFLLAIPGLSTMAFQSATSVKLLWIGANGQTQGIAN